jgi:hypothetical protein
MEAISTFVDVLVLTIIFMCIGFGIFIYKEWKLFKKQNNPS